MPTPQQRLSKYLMGASFGLLFAGLSALAGSAGLNDRAAIGVGLGLVVAGLALSLASSEYLRIKRGPPEEDERER
jgi:hypothetical protein